METNPPAPVISRHKRYQLSLILAFTIVAATSFFIGRYLLPSSVSTKVYTTINENGERQLVFSTFWEAWDELHRRYIGELNEEDLFYGAVSGMVSAAGDNYTAFANPRDTSQFEDALQGSFSGVGIEMGMRNGLITVIAPLTGSPAEQAGVREGDIIVAINGEAITQETTLDDAVSQIRGPRGTEVTLTVIHRDARETDDVTIRRDQIHIESVKLETLDNNIAHVTVTNFNGDTAARFTAIMRQIIAQEASGLILDLRNNPGGYLQSSVDIASNFLEPGQLVVTETGKENREYKAKGNPIAKDIPSVVLVNGGSASSSEILAGALHDVLNVPIIGQKTFGKGSVQEFIKLKDGSSLRITVAKWYTPNGLNIDEEGIAPTIPVEQNYDTDQDEQLDVAIEQLL
jgi:carboxyl-terminal processing protease